MTFRNCLENEGFSFNNNISTETSTETSEKISAIIGQIKTSKTNNSLGKFLSFNKNYSLTDIRNNYQFKEKFNRIIINNDNNINFISKDLERTIEIKPYKESSYYYKNNFLTLNQDLSIENYYFSINIDTSNCRVMVNITNEIIINENQNLPSENYKLYLSNEILNSNNIKKDNRGTIIIFYSIEETKFFIIYEGMNVYINENTDKNSNNLYYIIINNNIIYFNKFLISKNKETFEEREKREERKKREERIKPILYNYKYKYEKNIEKFEQKYRKNFIQETENINFKYNIYYIDNKNIHSLKDMVNFGIKKINENSKVLDEFDIVDNNIQFNQNNLYITNELLYSKHIKKDGNKIELFYNILEKKFFVIYAGMNVYINENKNKNSNSLYYIILNYYKRIYFNKFLKETFFNLPNEFDSINDILNCIDYIFYRHGNFYEYKNGKPIFWYTDKKEYEEEPKFYDYKYDNNNNIEIKYGEDNLIINNEYVILKSTDRGNDLSIEFNFKGTRNKSPLYFSINEDNIFFIINDMNIYMTNEISDYKYYIIINNEKYYFKN